MTRKGWLGISLTTCIARKKQKSTRKCAILCLKGIGSFWYLSSLMVFINGINAPLIHVTKPNIKNKAAMIINGTKEDDFDIF